MSRAGIGEGLPGINFYWCRCALRRKTKRKSRKDNPPTPPKIGLLCTPTKQCCFQAALENRFKKKHLNVELEPYLMPRFLLLVLFRTVHVAGRVVNASALCGIRAIWLYQVLKVFSITCLTEGRRLHQHKMVPRDVLWERPSWWLDFFTCFCRIHGYYKGVIIEKNYLPLPEVGSEGPCSAHS